MKEKALKLIRNTNICGKAVSVYVCECGKVFRYKTGVPIPRKYCEACETDRRSEKKKRKRIHVIWNSMKSRCENQKAQAYKYYGGRGIKICRDWGAFENFLLWAENSGYAEVLSIERIDVNGDYCPENCKWIPLCEQPKNTRRNYRNRPIEIDGISKTIPEWCEMYGRSVKLFAARTKRGWSPQRALETPPMEFFPGKIDRAERRIE